ncbi:putative holin-like toxin [Brevibacillus laterosporus]
MAITHEAPSLLFQFGSFLVSLPGLVVTRVTVPPAPKSKTAIKPSKV